MRFPKPYTTHVHHIRLFFLAFTLFFLFSLCVHSFAQNAPQTDLPRSTLTIQEHEIDAQLAQTPRQQSIGLMWRASMPENEGMLFIFEQPARQCFWMKNTLLPLSAAFINDMGVIVNIADMQALSLEGHCSDQPVRFVLEMHQGWFKNRNIEPGDHVSGIEAFTH